jgi:O-antigen ligase
MNIRDNRISIKEKARYFFITILFFLVCAGSLFLTTPHFVNEWITPKWYWTFFCSAALLLVSLIAGREKITGRPSISVICLIIVTLCVLQAVYGILQYVNMFPAVNGFRVTGSFDNPAGFAASLCAGFPFAIYFVFNEKSWKRYTAIAAGMAIVAAVVLSASRAGIISLSAVCMAVFFYKIKIAAKWKWMMVIILLCASVSGLYFLKKDSADGRLLIWRCTWEMIKDKPLFGHGYGGFKANYMNYQAEYFETHTGSKYAMLADNVRHPFNEYLLLAVNFGLIGVLVLFLLLYQLWKTHRRNPDKPLLLCIACWCILSTGVFAMFSYPLKYPFTLVTGLLSLYICGFFRRRFHWREKTAMIGMFVIACYFVSDRMLAEMKWKQLARQSLLGKTEQALPSYRLLHNRLRMKELFLYNYAAELNVVRRYGESLSVARECERLMADYDLQMLIADNCRQLKRHEEAEAHYKKASMMCPVKFVPLYELATLYLAAGQTGKALTLAQKIVDKEIKIPSATVHAIKNRMRELLNGQDTGASAEAQGRNKDVSPTKIPTGQDFLSALQTPEGRLPP